MLFRQIRIPEGRGTTVADVLIQNGSIAAVSSERLDVPAGTRIYDGQDKLLLPGLVNAHCHIPMTLLRSRGHGLNLQRWLTEAIFPFEAKMTANDMRIGTKLGLLEMVAGGVTSFSDMYMYIVDIADECLNAGIRANLCYGIGSGDEPFENRRGVQETLALLDWVQKDNRADYITVDAGLHAEYTSDEETVRAVAAFAAEHNLSVHTHLSETRFEHEQSLERHGMTPLAWFEHCGLLHNKTQVAHAVHISADDIALMQTRNVVPVHCPGSNLKLGSGIADIPAWQAAGLPFAVGTDGAASNNNLNQLEELHLASMIQKGYRFDPLQLDVEALMSAAFENGYRVQGRAGGQILPDLPADLFVLDLDRPHLIPADDPLALLFHSAQASDVCLTMAAGKILYENGEFKTLDAERIKAESAQAVKSLLARI